MDVHGFLQAIESTMVLTPKQQQWQALVFFGVGRPKQVGYILPPVFLAKPPKEFSEM